MTILSHMSETSRKEDKKTTPESQGQALASG